MTTSNNLADDLYPAAYSSATNVFNGSVCFLHSLRIGLNNCTLYFVFGRFPAGLGPMTRSNKSGSKTGAKCTQVIPGDQF